MATAQDHTAEHRPGEMNISEQSSTFHSVVGMFKWGSLAVAAALVLLTLWFCTPAGFVPAVIVALIMVVIGVFVLRGKASGSH